MYCTQPQMPPFAFRPRPPPAGHRWPAAAVRHIPASGTESITLGKPRAWPSDTKKKGSSTSTFPVLALAVAVTRTRAHQGRWGRCCSKSGGGGQLWLAPARRGRPTSTAAGVGGGGRWPCRPKARSFAVAAAEGTNQEWPGGGAEGALSRQRCRVPPGKGCGWKKEPAGVGGRLLTHPPSSAPTMQTPPRGTAPKRLPPLPSQLP